MFPDRKRVDLDQFLSQLYKFPNLRCLSVRDGFFRSSDAIVIGKKVTEILTLLEGLRVEFYDENNNGEDMEATEIQWIYNQKMCRYTTIGRKGRCSSPLDNTSGPFERLKGTKYPDDFYYGVLRY
ncbi:hypothetical protein BU17DRAFT_68062 [Hysterangium stoloniferum]|nr:hypothetical protein BU17DRAFT_68062 [Hysterangium stoloniferum]